MRRTKVIRITAFIAALSLPAVGVLMMPVAGEAQQAARQVKIGVLCAGTACPFGSISAVAYRVLSEALERVGLVQGRTLQWDIGGIVTSEDEITVAAKKLVSRRPDVILVWSGNVVAARAAKEATQTIPIVLMAVPDVVEHGLVSSLRRPGSNVSGTSVPMYDLTIKQLQLLNEISPRLKSLVVIQGDLDDRGQRQMVDRLRGATASLQLDAAIRVTDVTNAEQALRAAPAGTSAVFAIGNLPFIVQRRVEKVAFERRLPFVSPWRALYGGGGNPLISYGPRFSVLAERTASLIDRIVKGARPQDLPMEEPTSYELIIDGVMAKALGLTIPPGVRARADEVLD